MQSREESVRMLITDENSSNNGMKQLTINSQDGFPIAAHLFEPEAGNGKLVIINSATGVKQQIYFSFAKYLADAGFTVITYDYRGIGLSKPQKVRNLKADMRMWGTHDFKAVTTFAKSRFKDYQWYGIGHSVGALILGFNPDSMLFRKFIFVGTQDAYFRHLPLKIAAAAALGFGIVVPISNFFLGYFPANRFGLGESLPKGSAADWRTLILHRKSTYRLYEKADINLASHLKQSAFIIYAEDDPWVKMKGMESLMQNVYPNMKKTYREIRVSESAAGKIGHINFFRSYNREIWHIAANEMN